MNRYFGLRFVPSMKNHLEDVSGVGQRGGQDARHNTTEDVDDHGLLCQGRDNKLY